MEEVNVNKTNNMNRERRNLMFITTFFFTFRMKMLKKKMAR